MKIPKELQNDFYQNLGKLFYAIAAADKIVKDDEIETLKKNVNTHWLSFQAPKSKEDIEPMKDLKKIFFECLKNQQTAMSAFQDFKSFFEENQNLFDDEVKILIWKTAKSIADSFSGKNKSELVMLVELSVLFDKDALNY
jgi:hypothetical protein